jgi:flavoprotein
MKEKDANTPFIVAGLQTKKYDALLVAPLTANSTAKIALGISDTLVTNAVAQANKAAVPIYTLPVDQKPGVITTLMPSGGELSLGMRPIDLKNTEALRRMPGINVLNSPEQISIALNLQRDDQKGEHRVE